MSIRNLWYLSCSVSQRCIVEAQSRHFCCKGCAVPFADVRHVYLARLSSIRNLWYLLCLVSQRCIVEAQSRCSCSAEVFVPFADVRHVVGEIV